jgi:hypothetical protein
VAEAAAETHWVQLITTGNPTGGPLKAAVEEAVEVGPDDLLAALMVVQELLDKEQLAVLLAIIWVVAVEEELTLDLAMELVEMESLDLIQ